MNMTFQPRTLDMKTKQTKQQVVILAGLHVVSRDFLDEFPCSGGRVVHKISVKSDFSGAVLSAMPTCYQTTLFSCMEVAMD